MAVLDALGTGHHTTASRVCLERLAAQADLLSEMKALKKQKKAVKKRGKRGATKGESARAKEKKQGICFCCHKICQVPKACSRCKAVYWSVRYNTKPRRGG